MKTIIIKNITTLVATFLFTAEIQAQVVKIPLEIQVGDSSIFRSLAGCKWVEGPGEFRGFTGGEMKHWRIGYMAFNLAQDQYDRISEGTSTFKKYQKFVRDFRLDTGYVYTLSPLKKNRLHVFTGIDQSGIKTIIVDANNNKDFSDDSVHRISLRDKEAPEFQVKVNIEYFDGQEVQAAKIPLWVSPFSLLSFANADSIEKLLNVTFIKRFNYLGLYQQNGRKFQLYIRDNGYGLVKTDPLYRILVKETTKNHDNDFYGYRSDRPINIGKQIFRMNDLKNDTLFLVKTGQSEHEYGKLGTLAPPIQGQDLVSKQPFSLKGERGKYVVLDFWGSWCKPCIALIPELREHYEKYDTAKVSFVSVAYDEPADLQKLRELIKVHQMEWNQLWVNRDAEKERNLVKDYKIGEFPTTVLIGPKGKVLYRAKGAGEIRLMFEFLEKQLNGS